MFTQDQMELQAWADAALVLAIMVAAVLLANAIV